MVQGVGETLHNLIRGNLRKVSGMMGLEILLDLDKTAGTFLHRFLLLDRCSTFRT